MFGCGFGLERVISTLVDLESFGLSDTLGNELATKCCYMPCDIHVQDANGINWVKPVL